jgi:hypothetical protein
VVVDVEGDADGLALGVGLAEPERPPVMAAGLPDDVADGEADPVPAEAVAVLVEDGDADGEAPPDADAEGDAVGCGLP